MPERLRRLDRIFQRHPIYFITANTREQRKILGDSDVHARLIEFADKDPQHGAWLGAYVLMPDHLHAFLVLDDQRINLPKWVKSLKNALSEILRAHGVRPPQWQKGFSITCCAVVNLIPTNGIMYARILSAPDW
jgi:putative transposase